MGIASPIRTGLTTSTATPISLCKLVVHQEFPGCRGMPQPRDARVNPLRHRRGSSGNTGPTAPALPFPRTSSVLICVPPWFHRHSEPPRTGFSVQFGSVRFGSVRFIFRNSGFATVTSLPGAMPRGRQVQDQNCGAHRQVPGGWPGYPSPHH